MNILAMFYTTIAHGIGMIRPEDDIFNDVAAAGLAGVLFKSTGML